MFFWKRKKKEESFENKMREIEGTVLTSKDYRNPRKIEQYVVERLEQMIELTREIEDEKGEYRNVTAYLNDIQMIESLPEEDAKRLQEIAVNVVSLNKTRNEFLNSSKKLTDAQFTQLEHEEKNIPAAIKRLTANEIYRDTVKKDLKYLEREKSEWILRKEYLGINRKSMKNALYILLGVAATAAVIIGCLQLLLETNMYYGWVATAVITAVGICAICLKIQSDGDEISLAERSLNRAIVLENKVKIKFVNIENAVEYSYEKYHVKSAAELNQQWEYYLEAVREREKYQKTNEDLEYFNGRLVRVLTQYKLHDAKVWVSQAAALVEPREMVEIKHELIARRQKVRSNIEYKLDVIKKQRKEAELLLNRVGDMRPQVEEILQSIDKLSETL